MSLPLEQLMRELATYLNTPLGFERGVYSLIVPLENGRHQEIAATVRRDRDDREIIDFVSAVGPVHPELDPWVLLQANAEAVFCRVVVSRQMVYVLACQLLATAQREEVILMLREVANFADLLERRFFGGDIL